MRGRTRASGCALIAPLDPFLWDKKLIRRLFGFDYTWEIYTPETKRKFGAYVLPLLYGEGFAGRAEVVNDRKNHTLVIRNIWYEPSFQKTKAFASASKKCMKRFAVFNACKVIQWPEGEFIPTLMSVILRIRFSSIRGGRRTASLVLRPPGIGSR